MLVVRVVILVLGADASGRPIDSISAWIHAGPSICWVASPTDRPGYDGCCAWEYGELGNVDCWIGQPLTYENCCRERWIVCDPTYPSRDSTLLTYNPWTFFFLACGVAQRLLDEVYAAGVRVASCHDVNSRQRCGRGWAETLGEDDRGNVSAAAAVFEWDSFVAHRAQWRGSVVVWKTAFEAAQWTALQSLVGAWRGPLLVKQSDEVASLLLQGIHKLLFEDTVQLRDHMLAILYAGERERLRDGCGEICSVDEHTSGSQSGPATTASTALSKPFQCASLLAAVVALAGDGLAASPPPPTVPAPFWKDFTMNGRIEVGDHSTIRRALGFTAGSQPLPAPPDRNWLWTEGAVEGFIALAREGRLAPGPTSLPRVHALMGVLSDLPVPVSGQYWFVWGDAKQYEWWKPWMESLLLAHDVAKVVSIVPRPDRYASSEGSGEQPHPGLRPVTLAEVVADAGFFDGGVVLGLAGAGLGRHGDRINPFADLQMMAASWCLLRSGGILLAPPMPALGTVDRLHWPSHRVYGPLRHPHLVANYDLLHTYDGVTGVYRKPATS